MPVRNQNWYDLQANRRYPLDEQSTGLDDEGAFIRDNILVDCHIRFPSTLGNYLYIQGMTVAPALVSIVFGVADALSDTTGTTIAAITLPRTAPQSVNHQITPLQPGVAGWVVLGPGVAEEFVGRYAAPLQTMISQRCARRYRPLPVPTIGKVGLGAGLENIVNMTAQAPLSARHEKLTINGQENCDAIVLRLDTEQQGDYNPLQYFLGPCAERPESGTCPKTPIETINGVVPDCDGNITLVFEGFEAYPYADCGGVDVVSNIGLAEACAPYGDPRARTPVDQCSESLSDPFAQLPDAEEYSSETLPDGAYLGSCLVTPVCVDFSAGSTSNFFVQSGLFVFENVSGPPLCGLSSASPFTAHYTYTAANIVRRNIALFKNCPTSWALGKTISTELRLTFAGLRRNGGIVLNYLVGAQTTYLVAMIDGDTNQLRLLRFNGSSLVNEYSTNFPTAVGQWYNLSATPFSSGSGVSVTVAASVIGSLVPPVVFTSAVANYGNPIGLSGLYTDRAFTNFNKFIVED
jgi:hypothetical protein